MSDRIDFEIVCPNDHDQTVTFSQEEFEEALKSGALVFHCNTCDTDWPPSTMKKLPNFESSSRRIPASAGCPAVEMHNDNVRLDPRCLYLQAHNNSCLD